MTNFSNIATKQIKSLFKDCFETNKDLKYSSFNIKIDMKKNYSEVYYDNAFIKSITVKEAISLCNDIYSLVNEKKSDDLNLLHKQILDFNFPTSLLPDYLSSVNSVKIIISNDEDISNFRFRVFYKSAIQEKIDSIFIKCVQINASKLEISIIEDMCIIQARVFNEVVLIDKITKEEGSEICKIIYITMCDVVDNKAFSLKNSQIARMSASRLPERVFGARIITIPTENGYHMICRLLYKPKDKNNTLEQLGYEDFQIQQLKKIQNKNYGITIISGPSGSGKSHSLKSILSSIISESNGTSHIITIEDPVEGIIGNDEFLATQTNVKCAKSKEDRILAYNESIINLSKLKPDILMVSELNHLNTINEVFKVALSGIKIYSSIYSNNSLNVIPALINMGISPNLICDSEIISGIISQRLVKTLCPHCSKYLIENLEEFSKNNLETLKRLLIALGYYDKIKEVEFNNDIQSLILDIVNPLDLSNIKIRNTNGCEHCNNIGINGQTIITEIINPDEKYLQLIKNNQKDKAKKYWMTKLNGIDMLMHGLIKVKKGLIDPVDLENEIGYIKLFKNNKQKRSH